MKGLRMASMLALGLAAAAAGTGAGTSNILAVADNPPPDPFGRRHSKKGGDSDYDLGKVHKSRWNSGSGQRLDHLTKKDRRRNETKGRKAARKRKKKK